MTNQRTPDPDQSRSNGGGTATASGMQFQRQFGSALLVSMLTNAPVDPRLELGNTTIDLVRFETEAPVDDIMARTSTGGFIVVQAKTTVARSSDPRSSFGKTVGQFVRQYIACRDGDGSLGWNRALDPTIDRLVLAVGPECPPSVRYHLSRALRAAAQAGIGALNKAERQALVDFDTCVEQMWQRTTTEPFPRLLIELLHSLVFVIEFDPNNRDRAAISDTLQAVTAQGFPASMVAGAIGNVAFDLMTRHGGVDSRTLRRLVEGHGVRLTSPPNYKADIEKLNLHSASVTGDLSRYEVIDLAGEGQTSIPRDCQGLVESAAATGSLLLVGDPGTGKSGVLNNLARSLIESGSDVVLLAVDHYSVETVEGLRVELGLQHSIVDILDAWDGLDSAYLIIDALDATRGGRGEAVFRALIDQVLRSKSRWKVIASIRTFDLSMGQQYRLLFSGAPPSPSMMDPAFSNVRHIKIPHWTVGEYNQLLSKAPQLAAVLEGASSKLQNLAMVPFNTRLIADLVSRGVLAKGTFEKVSSQSQLLDLYWEHRVEHLGTRASTCLKRIVDDMVSSRTLRADRLRVAQIDPQTIDDLSHEGVLALATSGRWLQFRHHLLFDFCAAKLFFEPSGVVSGTISMSKDTTPGLMLAPALGFVLQEVWDTELDHSRYWIAATRILADRNADPVIRGAVSRMSAELPAADHDLLWLATHFTTKHKPQIVDALPHMIGAFAIRMEDDAAVNVRPWASLAGALSDHVADVPDSIRVLCAILLEKGRCWSDVSVGTAARALLSFYLKLKDPGNGVAFSVGFVADTIRTDIKASCLLLSTIFDPERFAGFGWNEAPALARKIDSICLSAPDFCGAIYSKIYSFEVSDSSPTSMGNSRILALTSNRRQDYDMARYALNEYFPKFAHASPEYAFPALVESIEGYLRRVHPPRHPVEALHTKVNGKMVTLTPDLSHIWGHDPNTAYGYDGDALLVKFLEYARAASETELLQAAHILVPLITFGIFWSRLFLIATERKGPILEFLWPYACSREFILCADTRKDAIDVIVFGYEYRSLEEREAFELRIAEFDYSDFKFPTDFKKSTEERIFARIDPRFLATEWAREIAAARPESESEENSRPFNLRVSRHEFGRHDYLKDFSPDLPSNVAMITAIDEARGDLQLQYGSSQTDGSLPPDLVLEKLDRLFATYRACPDAHEGLRVEAEDLLVRGSQKVVLSNSLGAGIDEALADAVWPYISLGAQSISPQVDPDTEESFAKSPSWGSPAPRVDAAASIGDLCLQAPQRLAFLLPELDRLIVDPHPAVRLQAGIHLIRIFDNDRTGFWDRLSARLQAERNASVLDHLISDVFGHVFLVDLDKTIPILQFLLNAYDQPEGAPFIWERLAAFVAIIWLRERRSEIDDIINEWLLSPARYASGLRRILATLRPILTVGAAREESDGLDLRGRGISLFREIVKSGNTTIAPFIPRTDELSEADIEEVKGLGSVLDAACSEMFFALGGAGADATRPPSVRAELSEFAANAQDILLMLGEYPNPHSTYYLIQAFEIIMPVDPKLAFDLTAHALRASAHSGFQYESLGADLLVKLFGIYLADHKEIFEDDGRRAALIGALEILMNAGWPSARRLLYRLPELIQ